jgi:hypothetical protein
MSKDLLCALAESFEHYLTLVRVVPGKTYDYAARGDFNLPVIEHVRHANKCAPVGEWTYIAVPSGEDLMSLGPNSRLYVGAQTSDRMFRGDKIKGENFHHRQMRRGKTDDNLVNYLSSTGAVDIHRLPLHSLRSERAVDWAVEKLARLPTSNRSHLGYWVEQLLLAQHPGWRWNKAWPSPALVSALRGVGLL